MFAPPDDLIKTEYDGVMVLPCPGVVMEGEHAGRHCMVYAYAFQWMEKREPSFTCPGCDDQAVDLCKLCGRCRYCCDNLRCTEGQEQ